MLRRLDGLRQCRTQVASYLKEPQNRNTCLLTANTVLGAAAGLVFWLILARILALPPSEIGIGYAIISLGTIVGVLAKGGLDTALIRWVPRAGGRDSGRLLGIGALMGALSAAGFAGLLVVASTLTPVIPSFAPVGWLLVALIGIFLVVTWLQDAFFIGHGDAAPTLKRNVAFSAARIVLPVPFVLLAAPQAVAGTWAVALAVSATVALAIVPSRTVGGGARVPRPLFLRSAARNITGSAAEFLPGLLLVPVVLAVLDADAAGFFGIAWTAAALLFLLSAAISRSALSAMVRKDGGLGAAIERAFRHLLLLVLPAAIIGIVFAPQLLGVFGADYAREGAVAFMVLCASILFVAPAYLYLAVLRAREEVGPLVAFPAGMMVVLAILAPGLAARFGLVGASLAWVVANLPFGIYATVKLRQEVQEVTSHGVPRTHQPTPQSD